MTADRVLERIEGQQDAFRDDPQRLRSIVDEMIIPHFDFLRMAQWVMGKHWRKASKAQKGRITEQFKELLVRTYATALLEYSEQKIEYLPVKQSKGSKTVTVKTRMAQGQGVNIIPIDYSMRKRSDEWKVYDISVDGVSLISTYRASFSSIIRKNGIDGLIDSLVSKNSGR